MSRPRNLLEELCVLFLDIDGVLACTRSSIVVAGRPSINGEMIGDGMPHSLEPSCLARFDPVSLGLVREVCKETKCDVVLSSSWRVESPYSPGQFARRLDLPIIDFTPRLVGCRGDEIQDWLLNHREYAHYAILDDSADMLASQTEHLVKVSPNNGVLFEDYIALLDILRGKLGGRRAFTQINSLEWED